VRRDRVRSGVTGLCERQVPAWRSRSHVPAVDPKPPTALSDSASKSNGMDAPTRNGINVPNGVIQPIGWKHHSPRAG